MKTLIVQSYRTTQVPGWIHTALSTVKRWAASRQYDYQFLGDEFFNWAPAWVRQQFSSHLFPLTDLARLYLLKDGLKRGYQRVVWVDADVLIFDPENFSVNTTSGFAFCREHMLTQLPDGGIRSEQPGINNAVMVFEQGQPMLDFYLYAAESRLKHIHPLKLQRTGLGPDLLQKLSLVLPLELLTHVGLFTPLLMQELAAGHSRAAKLYAGQSGVPLTAANLCHFVRHHADEQKKQQIDAIYERAIAILMGSRGEVINRHLTEPREGNNPLRKNLAFMSEQH
jgi:hypothetical protein